MSVKGTIYLEISTYLKQQIPGLKWVDKDRGQLENISNFVFPRPAIFLSFMRTEYGTIGNNSQQGTGAVRLRIAYENYADSFTGSVNQDKALAFFEFNEKVYETLQGLSGTHFSPLDRTADEDDLEHTNIIVTIQEYACNFVDDTAVKKKQFILTDPDVEVTHVKKGTLPDRTPLDDGTFVINKF